MKYFVPKIEPTKPQTRGIGLLRGLFGVRPSAPLREQAIKEKLGGLPNGLPLDLWPNCKICGKSQSFLAQMEHHSDRLDLGRQGRVLFVFQCDHDPGMCESWDIDAGANACLVVNSEKLTHDTTALPDDNPPVENSVDIVGWLTKDDGISSDVHQAFFSETSYDALDEKIHEKVTFGTRLGSVPAWIQSPDEAPKPDWQFLGQLDSTYSFLSPPSSQERWIWEDKGKHEGRTHYAQGPNFGDMGTAYLFGKNLNGEMQVKMFWQCS